MKINILLLSLFLYLISLVSFAGGMERKNCNDSEILVSLVDYSYCTPKDGLKSLKILGGKHTTVHVTDRDIEYSFAKIPTSVAILDIPQKTNIALLTFFEQLIDPDYSENGYSDIRNAFNIQRETTVSSYTNKNFTAYYIINDSSINNSIYLINSVDKYIYVVKGDFGELFAKRFLSGLRHIF